MIKEIEAATTGQIVWDKHTKGLHLRVLPSGRKWYFYYRAKSGKQRRPKIGDYPAISLSQAREMVNALKAKIFIGEDPSADWAKAKASPTINELFDDVYREHWNKKRYIESGHAAEVKRNYKNHIYKYLGNEKIVDVKIKQLKAWHSGLGEHSKTVANRCLAIISKVVKYAIENEFINQDLTYTITRHRERKRKRFASSDELVAIHNYLQLNKADFPQEVLFIYLLMFSGARLTSIERAEKSQLEIVDGNCGLLTIEGKVFEETGEEDIIVLPPQVLKLLDASTKKLVGIKRPRAFWDKLRAKTGIEDLWMRDLRRTYATIGNSNGVDYGQVSELLNHKSIETTKIYAKLNNKARIDAALTIADSIQKVIQ